MRALAVAAAVLVLFYVAVGGLIDFAEGRSINEFVLLAIGVVAVCLWQAPTWWRQRRQG